MDRVGLRELIRSGNKIAARRKQELIKESDESESLSRDPRVQTVLDRIAQIGVLGIDHKMHTVIDDVAEGLLSVYRLGIPHDPDIIRPVAADASFLVSVIHRVLLLGAYAVRMKAFQSVPSLVLRTPVERYSKTYWMRYSVTMAARGEVADAFRGKSIIGPASEYVREHPEFFGLFDENLDTVVNCMCQFDFLACVVVVRATERMSDCYPNFGGYYTYRTLPIVHDLVAGGRSREVVPDISNADLAEILEELDSLAGEVFSMISGWDHRYDRNETIAAFIAANRLGR